MLTYEIVEPEATTDVQMPLYWQWPKLAADPAADLGLVDPDFQVRKRSRLRVNLSWCTEPEAYLQLQQPEIIIDFSNANIGIILFNQKQKLFYILAIHPYIQ